MAFTREQIEEFHENRLRNEVLIPLFRAMGYNDVYLYHGGALEQGKDIVMWKAGDFTDRVNYAVVAKRGDVTGQTTGASSAGEVFIQIKQCFGRAYIDSTSLQEYQVSRCIVVASGRIPKESVNSLKSVLAPLEARSTTFINGDKLWEYVEEYLPEKKARALIETGYKSLANKLPGHKVEVSIADGITSLQLTHIDPTVPPALAFTFDPNELLRTDKMPKSIKMFIEKGVPFRIDKNSVKYISMPEAIHDFLDLEAGKMYNLRVETKDWQPQQVQLKRVCEEGQTAILDGIEFRCLQAGIKEVMLSNEHQKMPWKLVGKFSRDTQKFKLNFKVNLKGANVKQAFEWYSFQQAMSKRGSFSIRDLQTGIESQTTVQKPIMKGVPERMLQLLEMLTFIQTRTSTLLPFPSRITAKEDVEIEELFDVVSTGEARSIEAITFTLDRAKVRASMDNFSSPGPFHMTTNEDIFSRVCGVDVNLGPAKLSCTKIRMTPEDHADFLERMKSSAEDNILIRMVGSPPEAPFRVQHPKWFPKPPQVEDQLVEGPESSAQ